MCIDVLEYLAFSKVRLHRSNVHVDFEHLLEIRIFNQLGLVVYPMIYKVLAPSKRWFCGISEPTTVPPGPNKVHNSFPTDEPQLQAKKLIVISSSAWISHFAVISKFP